MSFSYDMRIPPCKRGGKETPGYRVGGILKRRWLEKVCNAVPAVLVVCFDWSVDLQLPQAAEAQAVSQLQHARRQARDRELRLLLFAVVHAGATDPEGQCNALRQQPEGQGLIVARGIADVAAKAQKLERQVYQNAMAFYADEEKRHRKAWSPRLAAMPLWAQSAMQVRMSLKVGFLSEFRRDARGALKSYIKAYEQLIHDAEITDTIERMDLCNHITIRMYQLYLQSHDVSAAVHHCRIHTATLRSCCSDDEVLAWRKWHWLAANHQLFAELLESVAQQLPLLIDQADMWQFPGFHYQSAAAYVSRLKQWARVTSAGRLPPAAGVGGELVPAPFVGQADSLERPEDCADPVREVQLRDAHAQASEAKHGDRRLQLLTRAQAACKERGYTAGAAVCSARMAEEYLAENSLVASSKLYERLRKSTVEGEARQFGPWPAWPALRRFALERAIFCSCHELGIKKDPAICRGTRPPLQTPVPSVSSGPEDGDSEARSAAARQRLLLDAFEYLGLPAAAGCNLGHGGNVGALQAELLEVVRNALAPTASMPRSVSGSAPLEVQLDYIAAEVEFSEGDATTGSQTGGFSVILRSPWAVPLEVSDLIATTSHGDIALTATSSTSEPSSASGSQLRWEAGGTVEARGAWPPGVAGASETSKGPRVTSIRMAWAAVPGVMLSVCSLCRRGNAEPPLPPFKPPGIATPQRALGRDFSTDGLARLGGHEDMKLRAEVFMPVDPAMAIIGEPFIFHVVVFAQARSVNAARAAVELWMSCAIRSREDLDDTNGMVCGPEEPSVSLIRRPEGSLDGTFEGGDAEWALLSVSGSEKAGQPVTELLDSGRFQPASGSALVLPAERLEGFPLQFPAGEEPLVVPVVVRCGRACRASVSINLCLRSKRGEGATGTSVLVPGVSLRFVPALQASFEDRAPGVAAPRASITPRRFTLKSLASMPVDLSGVDVTGPEGVARPPAPAVGPRGCIAPGASHAFVLPLGVPPENETGGSLLVRFSRAEAVATFFPWARGREALHDITLPDATARWLLPAESHGAATLPSLHVNLEHSSTGTLAEPVEVKVRVRRESQSPMELKVRVLRAEGSEGSDKLLLGGPASTQVMLVASQESQAQVCSSFTLVPLRPGWLAVPRVQVSAGGQEATSAPTSVFVFPSKQPCVWRALA